MYLDNILLDYKMRLLQQGKYYERIKCVNVFKYYERIKCVNVFNQIFD